MVPHRRRRPPATRTAGWHVDGRVDDLVNTGGLKVAPRLVEEAIAAHVPGVAEVVVVGMPDPEWGEACAAALVAARPGAPRASRLADVRAALRGILPDHALPRRVAVLEALPLRGPGKPDRVRAGRAMFTAVRDMIDRQCCACCPAPRRRADDLRGRRLHPDRREPRAQPAQARLGLSSILLVPGRRAGRLAHRRPSRSGSARAPWPESPAAAPRGPDDDPDFLRNL